MGGVNLTKVADDLAGVVNVGILQLGLGHLAYPRDIPEPAILEGYRLELLKLLGTGDAHLCVREA